MLQLTSIRIKEGLRTGHLKLSSDQWPLFLYKQYTYDPDDPWKGLLRSTILIFVCVIYIFLLIVIVIDNRTRHSNIFSRRPARSTGKSKLRDQAMLGFME